MNQDNLPGTPLHMQGQLITLMEAVASMLRTPPNSRAPWLAAAEDIAQLLDHLESAGEQPPETVLGMRDMAAWLSMRCSPAAPSPAP